MASAFEFADRLIVMADHRTDAGCWRSGEPVIRLALAAPDELLGAAVERALGEAPEVVHATHWKEYAVVRVALARIAGFRTPAPFDRKARMCSVRQSDAGDLTVMPTRHGGTRGPDKGFHERLELEFPVATPSSPRSLGEAVRRGLELSVGPPGAPT